jgi:hypothetical protein
LLFLQLQSSKSKQKRPPRIAKWALGGGNAIPC